MFNSLKKKLKEAVEKVSKSIKEEEKIEKEEQKILEQEAIIEEKEPYLDVVPQGAREEQVETVEEIKKAEEQMKEEVIEDFIKEKAAQAKAEESIIEKLEEKEHELEEKIKHVFEAKEESIEKETEIKYQSEPVVKEPDSIKKTEEMWKDLLGSPIKEPEVEKHIRPTQRPVVVEAPKAEPEFIHKKKEEIREVARAEIAEEIRKEKEEKKRGIFSRLFETTLTEKEVDIVLKELKYVLLENDVAVEVTDKICEDVSNELINKSVRRDKIENAIKDALKHAMLDVMKQDMINIKEMIENKDGVFTILFLGFNGVGKTTQLCKVAKKFKGFHPVVAAADTFRAASIEQLEEHSRRLGFRVVKHNYGADAAAVIFDARKAAMASGSKLVLADTAGRSHSNVNLMDELKKICRVISPDLKILVLDSVTANDIYEQSKLFNEAVGVDGIILTKTDVYDKGGAALSATYTIQKPILYLGVGQEYDDLKEFDPEEIVDNLLK